MEERKGLNGEEKVKRLNEWCSKNPTAYKLNWGY